MRSLARIVLVVALCLGAGLPARAETEVVVAGDGATAAGECVSIYGAHSGATGRSRWLVGAHWPTDAAAEPVCPETTPHTHLDVRCAEARSNGDGVTTVFLQAMAGRTLVLVKIIDRAGDADEVGVAIAEPLSGPCGAGAVVTEPVVSGRFTVVSA